MANYLLIESRDVFEHASVAQQLDLAKELKQAGNDVTVFLVQNGVLPARGGQRSKGLSDLVDQGIAVLADAFSLRERGISSDKLARGIKNAELDVVIDRMAAGDKVLWH
jgi:sulfur relay (sulfurtransferase) complex TusBCD TusD component (DsrE family)